MLNDRGEHILARFPRPVTVTPVLTLSSGLFITWWMLLAITSVWLAWRGWQNSDSSTWGPAVGGAAFSAFFVVGSAVMLRTNRMTLDREGFEIVDGSMWGIRKKRFLWRDVSAFEVHGIAPRVRGVTFDDARKVGGTRVNRTSRVLLEDYGLGDDRFAELRRSVGGARASRAERILDHLRADLGNDRFRDGAAVVPDCLTASEMTQK